MNSKQAKDAELKRGFLGKLSREQYEALGGIHTKTTINAEGKTVFEHVDGSVTTQPFTTEKAWYRHGDLLGVVLLDNIDNDWSYVALSRKPGNTYRAFNVETSFETEAKATEALRVTLNRGDKSNREMLLIDAIFRQTFKKPPHRNETLRAVLQDARRFVLDDTMTVFLTELTFTAFHGPRMINGKREMRWKKLYALLDEVRHFSRLPHRITWVEFSREAMLDAMLQIQCADDIAWDDPGVKPEDWRGSGQRIGWLIGQHPKIETAFTCTQFFNRDRSNQAIDFLDAGFCWQTDADPVPIQMLQPKSYREFHTGSELATGIQGYVRPNVGFHPIADQGRRTAGEYAREVQEAMENAKGMLRYLWMFLSTVNKIPLIGQREVKPSHGFVARGRYRQFLSHSVITLHVPEKAKRRIVNQVIGQLRRRAHQVRGHWRDDWRLPKGNKSLWIAEHQRGDASLGFVIHDYAVEHETNGGGRAA